MKYLICGLGNIGQEYQGTRHNIGFDVLDQFALMKKFAFKSGRYGDLLKLRFKGKSILFLKPNTYMNLSGKAVKYWLNKEKIMEKNCLILTDDLNLPFGNIRLKGKGGHGGHNGLKSIAEELKTDQYPRLRIGVGADFVQGKQVEHVLGRFSEAENKKLGEIKEKSIECILSFVSIGLDRSMNVFN